VTSVPEIGVKCMPLIAIVSPGAPSLGFMNIFGLVFQAVFFP